MKKILITTLALGTIAQAGFLSDWFGDSKNSRLDKAPTGYKYNQERVKTQYASNIIWGAGFGDHTENKPSVGIAVIAYGEGNSWSYTSVTDDKGDFIVRVEAGKPFKIKASNGDTWAEFKEVITGIAKGTTGH